MTVKNKVVVITGASSGIGAATAKLLAKNGAKVMLGARRKDRLFKLADEINTNGGQADYRTVDVTSRRKSKHWSTLLRMTLAA